MDDEGNWLPGVVTPEGSSTSGTPQTSPRGTISRRKRGEGEGEEEVILPSKMQVEVGEVERRNLLVERMEEVRRQRELEEEEDRQFLEALEDARKKVLRVVKLLASHVGQNVVGPRVGTALFLLFFPGWPLYK